MRRKGKESTTFLLARDKASIECSTSIVADGTVIDAETKRSHNPVFEISVIHASSTDEVRSSVIENDDVKKLLDRAEQLNVFLASFGSLWKDKRSRLRKELSKSLMSGDCKWYPQSVPPTQSISASQYNSEQRKGGPSSIDEASNRLKKKYLI